MNAALTVEAADLMRLLAPPAEHQNIKGRIAKAARHLGWDISRVRDVWYRDQRVCLRAEELEHLRAKARAITPNTGATDELSELRTRVARLEALLDAAAAHDGSERRSASSGDRRRAG